MIAIRIPRQFWRLAVSFTALGAVGVIGACSAGPAAPTETAPIWDLNRAEVVQWRSDDPSFAQNFAIEASGLAVGGRFVYIPSEKYSRLLVLEPEAERRVGVVRLDVPRHTELEGVAATGSSLLFCDEAHAAVYELEDASEKAIAAARGGLPVPVRTLELEGVSVRGGKIGFEGIEIDPSTGDVLLLLERHGAEDTGCVSRIFRLRREGATLVSTGEPLEVRLEDCAWRLTGLAWWNDGLIALKTQYPGERYEIVSVDLGSGAIEVLLDLTDFLRSLPARGWSNNVEGLDVAGDDALWLVADNAWTGIIDDPLPPPADVRSSLLRIPSSGGR